MYCIQCGKQIKDGAKFCPNCGARQDQAADKKEKTLKKVPERRQESYHYEEERPMREIKAEKISFPLHFFRFWLRGAVAVTQHQVRVTTVNAVMNIFPAGKNEQTIPMGQISSVQTRTSYKGSSIVLGIILVIIGVLSFASADQSDTSFSVGMGLLFLLLGIMKILSSVKAVLIIQRAGDDYVLPIPGYNKAKILRIKKLVDQALVYETEKTDTIRSTDRIVREMRMQYRQ